MTGHAQNMSKPKHLELKLYEWVDEQMQLLLDKIWGIAQLEWMLKILGATLCHILYFLLCIINWSKKNFQKLTHFAFLSSNRINQSLPKNYHILLSLNVYQTVK